MKGTTLKTLDDWQTMCSFARNFAKAFETVTFPLSVFILSLCKFDLDFKDILFMTVKVRFVIALFTFGLLAIGWTAFQSEFSDGTYYASASRKCCNGVRVCGPQLMQFSLKLSLAAPWWTVWWTVTDAFCANHRAFPWIFSRNVYGNMLIGRWGHKWREMGDRVRAAVLVTTWLTGWI